MTSWWYRTEVQKRNCEHLIKHVKIAQSVGKQGINGSWAGAAFNITATCLHVSALFLRWIHLYVIVGVVRSPCVITLLSIQGYESVLSLTRLMLFIGNVWSLSCLVSLEQSCLSHYVMWPNDLIRPLPLLSEMFCNSTYNILLHTN